MDNLQGRVQPLLKATSRTNLLNPGECIYSGKDFISRQLSVSLMA